jgi:hypothetical protein
MGRTNKSLQGAFTSIAGSIKEKTAYEQFLDRFRMPDEYCLASSSPSAAPAKYSLAKLLADYKERTEAIAAPVSEMAHLEALIMQVSAKDKMDDIIIYFNKQKYVYARCPFYRTEHDVKELRVIIGPIKNYIPDGEATPANLEKLNNDDSFMTIAKQFLTAAMNREINETIKSYDILKNNLEYSK